MLLVAASLSWFALWFCQSRGYALYYGDAQAHVNIARRVIDSRTPGTNQFGSVWLPLPHLLMLPMVRNEQWWRSGLAGAVPAAAGYVVAAGFLFAAVARIFGSLAAGWAAMAVFALNPNLLYLQSTPMTEGVFFGALSAVLYFTVTRHAFGAGVAACAATLTRYEGWLLIPVVSVYFLAAGGEGRFRKAVTFSVLAAMGPLSWLAHNWWWTGDWLEFYRGPYSARAIQGAAPYPGQGDWAAALQQFRAAAWLCLGAPMAWIGAAGAVAALGRRAFWPVLLLSIAPIFYVWSVHSAGTPIFVPHLPPKSYYNTRYGLALLPLAALGCGALVAWSPKKWQAAAALSVVVAAASVWFWKPEEEAWITWKESEVNSHARREWTRQAANYLGHEYRTGQGILTTFGDVTGIFQQAGIPLRETLTWDNWPLWPAAVRRPELFLREEWAVAVAGDPVQTAIGRSNRRYPRYRLAKTIVVKGAPVVEIYQREKKLAPR